MQKYSRQRSSLRPAEAAPSLRTRRSRRRTRRFSHTRALPVAHSSYAMHTRYRTSLSPAKSGRLAVLRRSVVIGGMEITICLGNLMFLLVQLMQALLQSIFCTSKRGYLLVKIFQEVVVCYFKAFIGSAKLVHAFFFWLISCCQLWQKMTASKVTRIWRGGCTITGLACCSGFHAIQVDGRRRRSAVAADEASGGRGN